MSQVYLSIFGRDNEDPLRVVAQPPTDQCGPVLRLENNAAYLTIYASSLKAIYALGAAIQDAAHEAMKARETPAFDTEVGAFEVTASLPHPEQPPY